MDNVPIYHDTKTHKSLAKLEKQEEKFKFFFIGNMFFSTCLSCKVVYFDGPVEGICVVCDLNINK